MCTFNTNILFLTWRKDKAKSRHIIGVLKRINNDSYSFSYLKENVKKAKETDDFSNYPAFKEIDEVYTENVLEIFNRRLLNPQRSDYDSFLNYWGAIKYKNNIFAILGLTGAKLLTDNFEFIAPHTECPANFYTDISWINTDSDFIVNEIKTLTNNEIEKNIKLETEPDNIYDKKAVKVLFKNELLGYIKSIHSENIYDALNSDKNINIKIANVIKNGTIKEILLNIYIMKGLEL